MKRLSLLTLVALLAFVAPGCDTYENVDSGARITSIRFVFSAQSAIVNGTVASRQYDVPELSLRIAEGGAVLAFFREQGTWTAMPYTFADPTADGSAVARTVTLGYAFEERLLEVFYEASHASVNLRAQPDREIKLVMIDASVLAGKTDVDLSNYEAVKYAFGLED